MQTPESVHDPNVATRLAHLEALTDSTLTQLDVDELLAELLPRVRDILDCDTAAVLILDEESDALVARAACGIEEEVRQGVRIPIGRGFAGRIAATNAAVRLDHVDATTVSNPILWEKGIEVMLGVPLMSGDSLRGVLHVGRLERRPFSDQDIELLRIVGDRITNAFQTNELANERVAARMLERSLLPSRPPDCPGLEFAARYVAAEQYAVGGDWYDLFTLPSGQLWIVVGDVAGHGLRAAIVMGRIRSALRAYTLIGAPPEKVLDLVDAKVSHFEMNTMATIACAVADPPYEEMTIAIAGHPPPALVAPGGPASLLDVAKSPPIGVEVSADRRSSTCALPPDAVLAFYTDGLIERRGEPLDRGFERLRNAMSPGPADTVARDIMRRVIGNTVPGDDVALVVVRRTS